MSLLLIGANIQAGFRPWNQCLHIETEAILRGATDVITIDWSKYTGWISSLEPMPPHRETPIEILSPWELKWTYPAAMASFNPDEVAPVSAEIIVPKWHKSCASFY